MRRSAAATLMGVSDVTRRLARPRNDRWIAGVCSALARRFGMSPGVMRLIFVVSCLLPGPQFLAYLVLWILLPNE
jgi:phage shock protein PspC (stress-responsive transcriptional regulator)